MIKPTEVELLWPKNNNNQLILNFDYNFQKYSACTDLHWSGQLSHYI